MIEYQFCRPLKPDVLPVVLSSQSGTMTDDPMFRHRPRTGAGIEISQGVWEGLDPRTSSDSPIARTKPQIACPESYYIEAASESGMTYVDMVLVWDRPAVLVNLGDRNLHAAVVLRLDDPVGCRALAGDQPVWDGLDVSRRLLEALATL